MSTPGEPDDPTRALDGFSDLLSRLHATTRGRPSRLTTQGPRASRWGSDDIDQGNVIDLPALRAAEHEDFADTTPMLDLYEPPAPPGDSAFAAIDQATVIARTEAAARWLAQARAAESAADDTLELLPALGRKPRSPRLLAQWQPGTWVAASKPLLEAHTELLNTPSGPVVETYPPQRLVALWASPRTDGPHLGRWPWRAFLAAAEPDALDDAVLGQVPGEAPMWWLPAHSDLVDWALIAEILMIHSATLRPFQIEALKTLIDEERTNSFSQANSDYRQDGPEAPVQRHL